MAGGDEVTDARFPERWLNDRRVLRLSNAGFRLFVTTLTWSVSNRTDGVLTDEDLKLFHAGADRADELARLGLWERDGDRWIITDFFTTQTTAAQLAGLDHKRVQDRERKARQRARERDVTPEVTRDIHRDTKARPGQARTGQDSSEALSNGHHPGREPWPSPRPLHPRTAAGYDN